LPATPCVVCYRPAVLVPLFLGWFTLQAQLGGLNGPVFSLAVFATANIVVFTYLIWTGGRQLNLMEAEKHAAEESFRLAFEASPSGMIISDRDGTITLVNARAEELFGYRREELLGNSIDLLVPEWSREAHGRLRREFFNAATPGALRQPREVSARRKDGTQFLAEVGLNPIETQNGTCILSSLVDVTARRRAEEERQKFVSLADRSLEFIGMCDLNYNPYYINSAGLRLVGLDNLEAWRVKVQDYFFPEDRSFVINEFLPQVLRDGHGEVEIRFRHFKTGAAIWMLYNVFSVFDIRGTLVRWATVSINISDRKKGRMLSARLWSNCDSSRITCLPLCSDVAPTCVMYG
jgi:PAS domain S-box-containing protein